MNRVRARGVRAVVPLMLWAFVFAACTQGAPQTNSNTLATPSGAATTQTLPQATLATSVDAATDLPVIVPTAVPSPLSTILPTALAGTSPLAPAATGTATVAVATGATAAVTTANPSGANAGLGDLIVAAQRALMSTKAYRGRTVTTLTSGATTTITVAFVAPDRFSIAGLGGQDFIIIGTSTWQRGPNTGWQKSPIDMSGIVNSSRDPKVIDEMAKSIVTSEVQQLADETLVGRPMHVYQYNTAFTSGDKTIHGTSKIWIGADDGLPYRQESDQDSLLEPGRTHRIITYDYNSADIRIDAPVVP